MEENSSQGIWDHIADEMLLEFSESGHPIFRATQKQRTRKTVDSFCCRPRNNSNCFCMVVFANQLSIYGAVAAFCEEFDNHQDGSGEPWILMGRSIVLREVGSANNGGKQTLAAFVFATD